MPQLPANQPTPGVWAPITPPAPSQLPAYVQAQPAQPTQFVPASPVPAPTVPSFIQPLPTPAATAGGAQAPAPGAAPQAAQPPAGADGGDAPMYPAPQAMPTPQVQTYQGFAPQPTQTYQGFAPQPTQTYQGFAPQPTQTYQGFAPQPTQTYQGFAPQPAPLPAPQSYQGATSQPHQAFVAQPYDGVIPQPVEAPFSHDWHDPATFGGEPWGLCDAIYCGKPSFWVNADYLMWWVKQAPSSNPLVVTGPATDQFPGALDQPHTQVLYGNQNINFNMFSGLRLSAGMWSKDQRFGFEMSGFSLQQNSASSTFSGNASGQPFIGIPFINARTGNENVYFVSQNFADPNLTAMMTGSVNIRSTSELWGWEANGLWNYYRSSMVNASLVAGFKSMRLNESLQINESLRNLSPGGALTFGGATVDPSQSVSTYDQFSTQNTFYGGQLGTRLHFEYNRFSLDLTGKAALGVSQEVVNIAGGSALQNITGTTISTLPGGVFAQTSNIGSYSQNKFAVVPEGNVNLNYAVTDWCVLRAGYTFIYWSSVVRPGNQLDRSINPGLVPTDATYPSGGPSHPAFTSGQTSTFWTQGINFGLELRF